MEKSHNNLWSYSYNAAFLYRYYCIVYVLKLVVSSLSLSQKRQPQGDFIDPLMSKKPRISHLSSRGAHGSSDRRPPTDTEEKRPAPPVNAACPGPSSQPPVSHPPSGSNSNSPSTPEGRGTQDLPLDQSSTCGEETERYTPRSLTPSTNFLPPPATSPAANSSKKPKKKSKKHKDKERERRGDDESVRHRESQAEKEERPRKRHRTEAETHSSNVTSPSDAELHREGGALLKHGCNFTPSHRFVISHQSGMDVRTTFRSVLAHVLCGFVLVVAYEHYEQFHGSLY